jgi:hypothetical protein
MPEEMNNREISALALVPLATSVYVVWTPLYFLLRQPPDPPPTGSYVEMILPTGRNDEAGRLQKLYGFRQRDAVDRPLVVYEGSRPLPPANYEFEPVDSKNKWRFVTFRSSDGSDPRCNRRNYYAVLPD